TATVSASDNDVLVYKSATQSLQLTWRDRQGRAAGRVSEPALYGGVSLSPDAGRVAVVRVNPLVTSSAALWLLDLARGSGSRFATVATAEATVWSPDGSRIAFAANSNTGFETAIMQKSTRGNGQEERLFQVADNRTVPTSWSQDGRLLLYVVVDAK